jgi:hypothetical protein
MCCSKLRIEAEKATLKTWLHVQQSRINESYNENETKQAVDCNGLFCNRKPSSSNLYYVIVLQFGTLFGGYEGGYEGRYGATANVNQ